jgi:putative ABC transport system substrate-binding protein
MRRREFIISVGGAAAWPFDTWAQPIGTAVRAAFLGGASTSGGKALVECFRTGLRELGWIEGGNINIEYQWAEGVADRYTRLAAEIVSRKPDLIVVTSTPGTQAIQRATREIPVVFIGVSDPVASGIVASLARPSENITGVSNFLPATTGKLLELLKIAAPGTSRAGIIHNPDNPGKILELGELQGAGQTLGIAIEALELRSSDALDRVFKMAAEVHCDALVTLQDGVTLANRSLIVGYAAANRLPAIYQIREFVEAGGLISYGLNYCDHYRRGAYYADKILRGVKPSDLPVELPTKFELVINLKTAKALGLTVPPTLLATADEVIE